ncbi:lysosomal acid glucosylceramidase [Diabrotica virgifera virgifera]|uniref:Glucosylceramidase n=1 Tax=Diabrotica virgifera virgifera TaxID=50390 RepID=A0A6P7GX19_DIAVI|nr:lysosomal acid glucosylceramidase [Diabrotica virgifera virgifera]
MRSKKIRHWHSVCVCNATYCDELPPLSKLDQPQYQVFTSNQDGLRLHRTTGKFKPYAFNIFNALYTIHINKYEKHQTMFGFGGAFTDAFGINLQSVEPTVQEKVLSSYFSKSGIEYNVGRVPIGGTDFSTKGYSYDDSDTPDPSLSKFKLADEDYRYKLSYIRRANELNQELKLFASAWIAPKWMKTNNAFSGFGRVKDEYYQVWANYHKKFFDEYKKENITFWGVTTGNEPSLSLFGSNIPSNRFTIEEMKRWVGDHLGPTIRRSEYKDLKIMVLDDQRVFLPWFVDAVFSNATIKNYIDIVAVHWYWDDVILPVVLDKVHTRYPEKPLMGTEACVGDRLWEKSVELGSWQRGERYAFSVIQDIQHHFIGWTDWNMALDTKGGPTYIDNNVDAPIIINSAKGEFYKQPMYYSLGHFSKFVPRGSVRIGITQTPFISSTAFLRPDQGVVVVLQNRGILRYSIELVDSERGKISLTLGPHSLTTVVYY